MSNFEEYAYCSYLKEQNKQAQEEIDKKIYQLILDKQQLVQDLIGVVEYQKGLVNEILIVNKIIGK